MILIHEKLEGIQFNPEVQMLLCTGSFPVCLGFALSFHVLTFEDLASFWAYSFSICFSLPLA